MKIVHIITRFNVGGTATWLNNLSNSLIDSGHESFLLAGKVPPGEIEDSNLLEINGIRIRKLEQSISPITALLAFLQIRRCIKKLQPDIVNTHTSVAGLIGRIAAYSLFRKRPTIVHTVHGHVLTGYFSTYQKILIVAAEKMLARISDMLLFSGERVREEFLSAINVSISRTALVSPGVELPTKFSKQSARNEDFVVGWLGRFAPIKNPMLAIEVARTLPFVKFIFGGDGPLLDECRKLAPSNCKFMGWTRPEEFWQKCNLAFLTSKNEAQPISIIEAGILGIPAVTTPAGSAIEVVENRITGLVALPEVDDLSIAIEELVRDSSLRKSLGRNAQKAYLKAYSLEKQLHDHLAAYRSAIELRLRERNR